MEFNAKLDRSTQALTIFVIIVVVGVFFFIEKSNEVSSFIQNIYFAIAAAGLGLPYLLAPRKYYVDSSAVLVKRILGSVSIPVSAIEEIELYRDFGRRKLAVNIFGSSGFFGHFGLFWIKGVGVARVYLSSTKDCVRIRCGNKNYLLSPYPVEQFLETLSSFLPGSIKVSESLPAQK